MVPKPAPFWTDGIIPFGILVIFLIALTSCATAGDSVCPVAIPLTTEWQVWKMRFTPGGGCEARQTTQATAEPEEEDNPPYVSRECSQCLRVHRERWGCVPPAANSGMTDEEMDAAIEEAARSTDDCLQDFGTINLNDIPPAFEIPTNLYSIAIDCKEEAYE